MARPSALVVAIALAAAGCSTAGDGDTEVEAGPDRMRLTYAIDKSATPAERDQIVEIVEDRLRALGTGDATVEVHDDQLDVDIGRTGPNAADDIAEILGLQAELRFRPVLLVLPEGTEGTAPALTSRDDDEAGEEVVLEDTGKVRYRLGPAAATGSIIEDADAVIDASGEWRVALTMTQEGIAAFNRIAASCAPPSPTCPTGQLAIVLDSEVYSAPTVESASFEREDISIAGAFTEDEAKTLALVLRYGSIPVALTLLETSGP